VAEAKEEVADKKTASGGDAAQTPEPGIELAPWDPDTPYLRELKAANGDAQLRVYFAERKKHGNAPAFFLDVADFFFKQKKDELGLQVLSNVAELRLEDAPLLRVLAQRLAQLDQLELAALIFEEVLRLRPEEPQSYRDLALVLARLKQYPRAMELLAHVIMNQWARFDAIEVIALMELNTIIPKARAAGIQKIPVDQRLVKLLDLDVRISLSWDADLTDIDLWVIEPSGERTYYGHNLSTIGGLVSRDFTQGYGPEEYVLHRAMRGKYVVQTNFYGSGAQTLTGAVTLQLDLFTNYGRPNEKRKSITLRLSEQKETFTVGTLEF
jgi:tetratricopeptide (TPR) repeat protein